MPTPEVEELWQAITVLEAQEALVKLKVGVYPKMKASAQRKLHSELFKEAYPTSIYPPKTTTITDLNLKLNGGPRAKR